MDVCARTMSMVRIPFVFFFLFASNNDFLPHPSWMVVYRLFTWWLFFLFFLSIVPLNDIGPNNVGQL